MPRPGHRLMFKPNPPTTMPWSKTLVKSSFMSLVGAGRDEQDRIEALREHILHELGDFGEERFPKVMRRVRYADDAQGLWYARGDIMAALSAHHGESVASEKMHRITQMFKGLLPRSLSSRPSPLTPS